MGSPRYSISKRTIDQNAPHPKESEKFPPSKLLIERLEPDTKRFGGIWAYH